MRRLHALVVVLFVLGVPTGLLAGDVTGSWTLSWPYADSPWSFTQSGGDFSAGVAFPELTESWYWRGTAVGPILSGMYASNRAEPPGPVDAGFALAVVSRDRMAGLAISNMGNGFNVFCGIRAPASSALPKR